MARKKLRLPLSMCVCGYTRVSGDVLDDASGDRMVYYCIVEGRRRDVQDNVLF
jgi:hypothetical protein